MRHGLSIVDVSDVDVSEDGACLDVGGMAVPKIFGLGFTGGGVFVDLAAGRAARRPFRDRQGIAPGV